ncbi:MAG: hypothetical protein HQK53_19975, partial [Oligoflexia bacterium]|nr:hypothetical protein [Oligoflexia bacterium]
FTDIVENDPKGKRCGLQNVVVSFGALLELARLRKIQLFQDDYLQEIYFELITPISDFDINLIDTGPENDEGKEHNKESSPWTTKN